jgi:hypothetical protein
MLYIPNCSEFNPQNISFHLSLKKFGFKTVVGYEKISSFSTYKSKNKINKNLMNLHKNKTRDCFNKAE